MKKITILVLLLVISGCTVTPNLSDETSQKILSAKKHHLSFRYDPVDWDFANVEKTDAQLNRTEITFLFNKTDIGSGKQGLANLRHILSKLPGGTTVTTIHCLGCRKNRWSDEIRKIDREIKGVKISCDGAF